MVATYGSAETAGGCVYDGMPLDGVAVAIGTEGRIRIAGPTLFDGYDGDPELTAEALVDGWFLTSDAGRLDEDGRLTVLGRVDDMVVSGGVNVPRTGRRGPAPPASSGGGRGGARRTRPGVGQPGGGVRGRRARPRRGAGLGRRRAPAPLGPAAGRARST